MGQRRIALALLCLAVAGAPRAAVAEPAAPGEKAAAGPTLASAGPALEPKAIALLKATSAALAAARSMTFRAVIGYESPSRLGPALVYTTTSDVAVQRPDKLRVVTPGDGPASEFTYDGTSMVAFAPAEKLVARADAPPTIDAALEAAYRIGDVYFPFADVIVADPYGAIAGDLRHAFTIGQSKIVGGTTTDMVAYVTDYAFVQLWIGAEDRLPRRIRAVYRDDPLRLRHDMVLSDWKLDVAIPAETFRAANAADAKPIAFDRPIPLDVGGAKPAQAPAPK